MNSALPTSPVRTPDLRSPEVMTRRAWWLVALNLLIPGSAQVLAGSRRLGRFGLASTLVFWALIVIAGALYLFARGVLLAALTNSFVLGALVVVALFYGVLWVILTLDTLRLVKLVRVAPTARAFVAGLSIVALTLVSGTAAYAAVTASAGIGLLGSVFSGGQIEPAVDGRYNILLLGGDAGPDRQGLRPDSVSVASVDAETGQVVLFGIPRNLEQVPFVEGSPLWGPFPDGYDCGSECLIDYLYTEAEVNHTDLYPDAEQNGSRPGVEAMRDAVQAVLGLEIQYYVLIDMQGFSQLIDALGGVDIEVAERVPLGSNQYDDGSPAPAIGYIEAGPQRMSGETALWYARSRYGTTDYERMARQRQVQQAIIAQANPANVLANFVAIAKAGAQVVSTDIPEGMLSHFVELGGKARELPVVSVDFVPPEVNVVDPDYDAIRERVQQAVAPPDEESAG
jgi:LCP family protein required for cell wall assembly